MLADGSASRFGDKTTNNRVLNGVLAGIPAFGYLLYFTGRTYSDAYYSTIGIPSDILSFGFWDYVYFGARDLNIMIPLAFSAMFVGFVFYLTESDKWYYKEHYSPLEYGLPMVYLVWYVATLLFLVLSVWLAPALKTEPVYAFFAIMLCLALSVLSIPMLFDKTLLARIKEGRIISRLFLYSVVIALVFFPHTSADAWGRLEAIKPGIRYPLIELHAPYPVIDDIRWERTSNNCCWTVGDLYLLLSNQQYLVVRSVIDSGGLYVVPIDDILSVKVVNSAE